MIAEHQEKRIAEFKNMLLKIPDFRDFFKENHAKLVLEVMNDLKQAEVTSDEKDIQDASKQFLNSIMEAESKEAKEDKDKDKDKVKPTPLKEEKKPTPESLSYRAIENIKKMIKASMDEYLKEGLFGKWSRALRNNDEEAKNILKKSMEFKPHATDVEVNLLIIQKLKGDIETSLAKTTTRGDYYTKLLAIKKMVDHAYCEFVMKKSPSIRCSMSHS